MAYESSDRPQEAGYFESSDTRLPDYTQAPEARDNSFARQTTSSTSKRSSPPNHNKMGREPERAEPPIHNGVSPELMEQITADITARVKKDLVEHFKQTGTIDEPRTAPMQRDPSNKSNSTSSPPPTSRRVYTPPSPIQAPRQANISPPIGPAMSPPSSPLDKPSGVRFSDREPKARPAGTARTYSSLELSTIDKCWGRLFDNEGNPTERLGQILRGLANHIIDDFLPKRSIVIIPSKMAEYYSRHKLDNEIHSFASIFEAQSNDQISQLYQDLGCQHHLVQEDLYKDPVVPALTPVGFAHWMTINIMSYPEEETRRLQKVVLAMPIDADGEMVDGKPERLPKQISRHLLPGEEDRKSRKLLDRAVSDFYSDIGSSRKGKKSATSPPLSRATSSSQPWTRPAESQIPKTKPIERDRMPYVGSPSVPESAVMDDAIKIERERQPYTAQPGGGKIHQESVNFNAPGKDIPSRYRASSTSQAPRDTFDTADPRNQRPQSIASQNYTPQYTRSGPRRPSSPPLKTFSNSTPSDINASATQAAPPSTSSSYGSQSQTFSPFSQASSNSSFPPPPPPIDLRDKRSREDRSHHRRGTDDEARFSSEFSSPRDAERWDRLQDLGRAAEPDRSERGSIPIDPRDPRSSISTDPRDIRGAVPMGPRDPRNTVPYEEYYRDKEAGRGGGYDDYSSRRY